MGIVLMPAAITDSEIVNPQTVPGGTYYAKGTEQTLVNAGAAHLTDYLRLGPVSWSSNFTSENIIQGITAQILNGSQTPLKSVQGSAVPAVQLKAKWLTVTPTHKSFNLHGRTGSTGTAYTLNRETNCITISKNDLDGIDPKFVYANGGGTYYYIGGGVMWSTSTDGSTSVDRGMMFGAAADKNCYYYLLSDNNSANIYCSANGIQMPVQVYAPNSIFWETTPYYVLVVGV